MSGIAAAVAARTGFFGGIISKDSRPLFIQTVTKTPPFFGLFGWKYYGIKNSDQRLWQGAKNGWMVVVHDEWFVPKVIATL